VPGCPGIDPDLFFAPDGTVWFTYHGSDGPPQAGLGIFQRQLDPLTFQPITPARLLWRGTGGPWPEGPHLYHRDGTYYLLIAEGGTEYGHSVTIARAPRPDGPFEPCPHNPILTHRHRRSEPLQATGHGDLVQGPDGSWWIVFLAIRPERGILHHLGRETCIAPVTWSPDGWPVVNSGRPVPLEFPAPPWPLHPWPARPARTDLSRPLGPEWVYLRNPSPENYTTTPEGLALHANLRTLRECASPTFVGVRQQRLVTTLRAELRFDPAHPGDAAGIALLQNERHHYRLVIGRDADGRRVARLRKTIDGLESVAAEVPLAGGPDACVLEIGADPDRYQFFVTDPAGERHALGHALTRYLASEIAGGFTGVIVGLHATATREPAPPATFGWLET